MSTSGKVVVTTPSQTKDMGSNPVVSIFVIVMCALKR